MYIFITYIGRRMWNTSTRKCRRCIKGSHLKLRGWLLTHRSLASFLRSLQKLKSVVRSACHAYTRTHTHTNTYAHILTHIQTHLHTHTHTHTCIHLHTDGSIFLCVCDSTFYTHIISLYCFKAFVWNHCWVDVYSYIHICIYVYTYMYMYIYMCMYVYTYI